MSDRQVLPRSVLVECPHGDPTCPCPDGLACHYEGSDAMACPLFITVEDKDGLHCHVEGCRWTAEGCGLAKLGAEVMLDPPVGSVHWRCGVYRSAACDGGRVWTS